MGVGKPLSRVETTILVIMLLVAFALPYLPIL